MNRAERRAHARRTGRSSETLTSVSAAATAAGNTACEDCTAHMEPVEYSPGVLILNVMHDDTCPSYREMKRAGTAR